MLNPLLFLPVVSMAAGLCSPLNYCRVEKRIWTNAKWKTDYSKELSIEKFCAPDRPLLQLENELGLELWIFPGEAADPLRSKPYVVANLYAHKLTHVVASGTSGADATLLGFTHRPSPRGKTLVEVTCGKK